MDYVELYYMTAHGCYPFDTDENKIRSQKTIDYLSDAGISEAEILTFIENAPASDFLSYEMIPESFWEESLIIKGHFYYHSELHILSKPPIWNPITMKEITVPFYREMKIKYTLDDVVKYFYTKARVPALFWEENRDVAAAKHLYDRCWKFHAKQLDMLLYMIDYATINEDNMPETFIQIGQYMQEVYEVLEKCMAQARLHKLDRIIWR